MWIQMVMLTAPQPSTREMSKYWTLTEKDLLRYECPVKPPLEILSRSVKYLHAYC